MGKYGKVSLKTEARVLFYQTLELVTLWTRELMNELGLWWDDTLFELDSRLMKHAFYRTPRVGLTHFFSFLINQFETLWFGCSYQEAMTFNESLAKWAIPRFRGWRRDAFYRLPPEFECDEQGWEDVLDTIEFALLELGRRTFTLELNKVYPWKLEAFGSPAPEENYERAGVEEQLIYARVERGMALLGRYFMYLG